MSATQRHAETNFQWNELYETLSRLRRDEPRRYQNNVSAGMQRRVEDYERRKASATVKIMTARAGGR